MDALRVLVRPLVVLAASFVFYTVSKYLYRATIHPLLTIPGPRLAGLTRLFAFYYDLGDSSVVKYLPELHKKYGPLVRLQPNEVHIHDWEAYNAVFRAGSPFDKYSGAYNFHFLEGSFFYALTARDAKAHRDLYTNHFSKATVNKLESLIHDKLALLLTKITDSAKNGEIVNARMAFASFAADTVTHWAYQEDIGALEAEGFLHNFLVTTEKLARTTVFQWYFPDVIKFVVQHMPRSIVPLLAMPETIREMGAVKIRKLKQQPQNSKAVMQSVFSNALHPDVDRKGQMVLSEFQLAGDGMAIFLAGSDTTATVLNWALWSILRKPVMMRRLQAELDEAMSEGHDKLYRQIEVETLPYLRACVKESLRMSMGVSSRLMRVTPPEGAELCGKRIPGGTCVSFSAYPYNYDPSIYPEPHEFRPERWLDPKANVSELESRMISFSKGGRNCIGINVAYCEIYNVLAHMFRRFDMELVDTTEWDMEWKDCFVTRYNGAVKVKVSLRE